MKDKLRGREGEHHEQFLGDDFLSLGGEKEMCHQGRFIIVSRAALLFLELPQAM